MKNAYSAKGIYRITNIVNGMSYIGKTGMNFGDRWDSHRSLLNSGKHSNGHLQNAWRKYGSENFEFSVVEYIDDVATLNAREKFWISKYRQAGLSYNVHDGGDGGLNLGKHLSESAKRKIGEKNRVNMLGRKASDQTKQKMSKSQFLRFSSMTNEQRAEYGREMSRRSAGHTWDSSARKAFSERQQTQPNGAKFTMDEIREIRSKHANGVSRSALASEYGTSPAYISSIVKRRRWAHI